MRRVAILAGVVLLLGAAGALRPPAAGAQVGIPQTDVRIRVIFMLLMNAFNPDIQVTDQAEGACFTGSLADPGRIDAWRCMVGNRIYDPCFVAAVDLSKVACVPTPWATDAVMITLTRDLPSAAGRTGSLLDAMPWGLELENGARCAVASTGAGGAIAGQRINYSCRHADGSDAGAVVGDIDRSQASWRVFVTGANPWVIGQMAVAVAWY
jgi:hypothetical protein